MLEAVLFPLLLTLYPLIGIRQGLDVSDTLYSLSNFQYFTTMDGTFRLLYTSTAVTDWSSEV